MSIDKRTSSKGEKKYKVKADTKKENGIIRVQKNSENPFVLINKSFLIDDRLSWKAKGILTYLLSKPDNWQVRVTDLANQSLDGESAIYSGLKELKEFGYLDRKPVYIDGKINYWESTVYEVPKIQLGLLSEKSQEVENADSEGDVSNSILEKCAAGNLDKECVFLENLNLENQEVEKLNLENPQHNNNKYFNNKSLNNKSLKYLSLITE